ncbi:hypothetical protein D3C78_863370 [compost metagenome]
MARVELLQVPLRQPVKTQQQVIVVLLKVRPGTGSQGIEVLGLIVERLENRELHIQLLITHDPPGFLDDGRHCAVSELRIQRCERDLLDALRSDACEYRLNRRLAITHRQLDRPLGPLRGHHLLQATTEHHQG